MNAFFDTPEFHDIDQFMECASKFMDIQSIQIQPGLLFIKDHYLEVDGVVINHYSTNRNLLDRFSIRPRHVNFVLTSSTTDQGKWCGIDVPINVVAGAGMTHPTFIGIPISQFVRYRHAFTSSHHVYRKIDAIQGNSGYCIHCHSYPCVV